MDGLPSFGHRPLFAPLLGHNLVRLVYLDEAGTDVRAPVMCVAGVIIHGDEQWPEVDRRILALIDKHIEPDRRPGFVFHATDIFHGARYFDRRKPEWADPQKRLDLLDELAAIIRDLQLPVVIGKYERSTFGAHSPEMVLDDKQKGVLMHQMAVVDCLSQADRWLEKWVPTELATVVHEDGTPAKQLIKLSVRMLRSADLMARSGMPEDVRIQFNLPLRRIIDAVNFIEKPDARPLQLADLCAFVFARVLAGKSAPIGILTMLLAGSVFVDLGVAKLATLAADSSSESQS